MNKEINGQVVDVLDSWGKNIEKYLGELYERSASGKEFYVPGLPYDHDKVYRCRLSWNLEDYLRTETECENIFADLHTIAANLADWEKNAVPEEERRFDPPEVEETWLTYLQPFDGEDNIPDDDNLLDHRADFDKEARSRLGDSKFALDEIFAARILEGVIGFNRKDPCEGGNKITNDTACILARAMILRKYCVSYEEIPLEENT